MSNFNQEIVNLNVGGTKFATSWQTLTWVPDTFFTSLLSGRIPTLRDESGAIFIDRDPSLFSLILNYLRTRDIDLSNVNLRALRHECEYFGITPLTRRLALCEEMNHSSCGDVLFYAYLPPPANFPIPTCSSGGAGSRSVHGSNAGSRKSSSAASEASLGGRTHSRNSSLDLRPVGRTASQDHIRCNRGHSRAASLDLRFGNSDVYKASGSRPSEVSSWPDYMKVQIIKAHHNWIVVAYTHFVVGYRLTDSCGWSLAFQSAPQESCIERMALNAKAGSCDLMLGVAGGSLVRLWAIAAHAEPVRRTLVGTFNLSVRVEHLLFVGAQLVALAGGARSRAGVWHTGTQHWQVQDVAALSCFDTAGSFLLLGTAHGAINYIDMQKFPLRMKDNDLLVTQLYKDPNQEPITAISVYLTPKTSLCGNWIEIAYGTRGGSVRVIVQHPETVGHGPQLFQTFTVHQSPITKVSLSEHYLVSVCSEYNHVRSWRVTRFRGMISTQPGTTPNAAFKVLALEPPAPGAQPHNDCGPYGEQDEEQIFIQKVVPDTDTLYVRLASNGRRVCVTRSVDGSGVSCLAAAECEGALRPRRLLLCGHRSGAVQLWDLTAPIDRAANPATPADSEEARLSEGGPDADELVRLVAQCELTAAPPAPPPPAPSAS